MLALAAHHRGDSQEKVQMWKRAAIQDLKFDANPTMRQGLQWVAANLLLSVLGVCSPLIAVSSFANYV